VKERSSRRRFALVLVALFSAAATTCGRREASRTADRVLARFRSTTGAKPLAASGMMRLSLSGPPGTSGVDEIRWESFRFCEAVRSAGLETARGIESGRAWYTDGDGVTRVVSDEVLRELKTRSYFFRHAWLFADRENAWLELGPADAEKVSLDLTPEGGNRLRLTFSRADGRLLSASAPRLAFDFQTTPTAWTDRSNPDAPVQVSLAWAGLPTGPIPNVTVGGERAVVPDAPPGIRFERRSGALLAPASISGRPVRFAIDAAESGPVAISPALAEALGLRFETDVWGRRLASGAALEIGGAKWPSLWVRRDDALPADTDARAGAPLYRETVLEIDPAAGVLRVHDPGRFAPPEGFYRAVIDDDGDLPVAILSRGKTNLRLAAGSDTGSAALRVAAASAARAGVEAGEAHGFAWGPVRLPDMPADVTAHGFFPDWGDDGLLGYPLLLRFHAIVDMPRRWIYLKPLEK
jgi:hypothetical protein